MRPQRIDIDVTDAQVRRGVIVCLAGSSALPVEQPQTAADRLAEIERAVADFLKAEIDLGNAQEAAAQDLRTPAVPHSRYSDVALEAYERKVEAQKRLSQLLGVLVVCSARRD